MRAQLRTQSAGWFAAALVVASPLAAQESPGQGFRFTVDPLVLSWEEVDVDSESAKFNEYRDFEDGLLLEELLLRGASADGNRSFELTTERGGRRDARYGLGYRSEGSWDVELDYNRIPHRFGNDGLTLFERTGDGRWSIEDSTQIALQAALVRQFGINSSAINYNFLNALLRPYLADGHPIDVGLQRDRTHVEADFAKGGDLAWKVQVDHEDREGTRPYGASFGFNNVTELPEPIDYRSTHGELSGEWRGEKGGLQFGGRLAEFENKIDSMVWDNPFRFTSSTDGNAYQAPGSGSVNGSAFGNAALAPDNEAMTLFLNGRGKFGDWVTQASASWMSLEQDATLLPYTLNSAIDGVEHDGATFDATDASHLPQASADREAQILALNASAIWSFAKNLKLDLRGRYYDYDNGSDRVEFPGYVRFHAVWEEIGRITVPYEYDRTDVSANLLWDPSRGTRLGLEAGLRSMDRAFREISSADETFARFTAGSRFGGWWLHGHAEYGDRSTSDYHVEAAGESFVHAEAPNNQPSLRKFDEAERGYLDFLAQADWSISESFDLMFGVSGRDEDYDRSRMGLVRDEVVRYNAELAWRLGEDGSLFLFGNHTDREVLQRSRQSGSAPSTNPLDDWQATFDEGNDLVGAGYHSTFGGFTIDLSGTWTRSDGEADLFSPPGGTPNTAVGFDDYEDIEYFTGIVDLAWDWNEHYGIGLGWRYEDYTTETFITRGLTNYEPGALLLDADNGDFQGDVITLRFRYRR